MPVYHDLGLYYTNFTTMAFASQGLMPCETHYPAHKLKFLALKLAVTEKFKACLYGITFQV